MKPERPQSPSNSPESGLDTLSALDRLNEMGVGFWTPEFGSEIRYPIQAVLVSVAFSLGLIGMVNLCFLRPLLWMIGKLNMPPEVMLYVLGGPAIILIGVLIWVANKRANQNWDMRGHFKLSGRLRIPQNYLNPVRLTGELEETRHGFDPEIYRVPAALGFDRIGLAIGLIGVVVFGTGAFVLDQLFLNSKSLLGVTVYTSLGIAAVGFVTLPELVAPTYLRVIPGRVDVVRDGIFRRGIWVAGSFGLKTTSIRLTRSFVFISRGGLDVEAGHSGYTVLNLTWTPFQKRIQTCLLQAATTNAPTPEVPSDRLLG